MTLIKFAGILYDIENPIIRIGSFNFDVSKSEEWEKSQILSEEGELGRIYLSILGHPEAIIDLPNNEGTVTIPEVKGIELSTATFEEIVEYLDDDNIKKSESMKEVCRKFMALHDKTKFKAEKTKVSTPLQREYALIEAENDKNSVNIQKIRELGKCGGGVFGNVRLDGTK